TWDCAQVELDRNMSELVGSKEWKETVEYQRKKEQQEPIEEGKVPEGMERLKVIVMHTLMTGELVQLVEILDLTNDIPNKQELGEHTVWV
ncbi:hypothetical protein FRC12_023435, partial [Ceratobasidium sp. 428]